MVWGEDEGEDEDAEDEPPWGEDDGEDGHHDEDDVPGLRMRMSSPGVRITTYTRMSLQPIQHNNEMTRKMCCLGDAVGSTERRSGGSGMAG